MFRACQWAGTWGHQCKAVVPGGVRGPEKRTERIPRVGLQQWIPQFYSGRFKSSVGLKTGPRHTQPSSKSRRRGTMAENGGRLAGSCAQHSLQGRHMQSGQLTPSSLWNVGEAVQWQAAIRTP